jgi:hypothetical protein
MGSSRGVALNTHPHLALRLNKEQNYSSTPFWAFTACSLVKLTFAFTMIKLAKRKKKKPSHRISQQ